MADSTTANNKRIAKNTLFLYFRMALMMLVSLYTSRVILQVLGVEDYGIYNVVGGVVSLFAIISGSLSTATQRFITFGLGKNDIGYLNRVFSTSIYVHIAMALFILLLAETLGLWFFEHKLQIPDDRINAAFWVYQSAVIASVFMIISIPYNATIIAHEKMGTFAVVSLLEAFGKLGIVYLLMLFSCDKLILYAVLLVVIQILVASCYYIYCRRNFRETKIQYVKDTGLLKEITSFASWSLMGNAAYISYTQGLNILLNTFFGPVVNASRGIAVQVQSAIHQFVTGFQTAINPQIVKSYASGDLSYMHELMFRSARFSFYLLFTVSLPILIETPIVLKLWLTTVPEYTVVFLRLIIITTWINSLANPLIIGVKATGRVKLYETVVGCIMLLILPVSYLFLSFGYPPYIVFVVHLFMEILAQVARVYIAGYLVKFKPNAFLSKVVMQTVLVSLVAIAIPVTYYNLSIESIVRFLIMSFLSLLCSVVSIYFIGLTNSERKMLHTVWSKIISRIRIGG